MVQLRVIRDDGQQYDLSVVRRGALAADIVAQASECGHRIESV